MIKKKNLPIEKQGIFKNQKPARVSADMFEFEKVRWKMSVHPYRLLMMVSQTISKSSGELFPELEYPLDKVFEYLGMEKDGRRYERLADACKEFREKGIDLCTTKPNGHKRWAGISFITWYEFATDYPALRLQINEKARPFLANLHQYALLQPKHYLKLNTEYQNWFYPYLKLRANLGKWQVKIEDLKYQLYLDNSPSYTTDKNANDNFFKRVIGIQKPKGKVKPNIPWDYIKNKTGDFSGTLAAITSCTDINVTAYPIKTGVSYTHLVFEISFKASKLLKFEAEKLHEKATANDLLDMGVAEPRKNSKRKSPQTMKDLFDSTPVLTMTRNPLSIGEHIPKTIISHDTLKAISKEQGISPDKLAKKMGYIKTENGNWEK